MGDKFLINLDIIRNTNRSLQNQKKKNLSILWKPEKHIHRTIEIEVLYELQISSKGVRCEF